MKHLVAVVILFCLLPDIAKAQLWLDEYSLRNAYGKRKLSLDYIEGSPFLNKEYKLAVVTSSDGQVFKDVPLRYNCYNDVFEFLREGNAFEIIPKEKASKAEFDKQVFRLMDYEAGGTVKGKGYFEILAEGKATLCKRASIKFFEEEPLKGYADPVRPRFDDFKETFWVSIKETPAKLITNSKKLIEILDDKKSDIQSYISKQKLGVKKADDLKKIIDYYNSL